MRIDYIVDSYSRNYPLKPNKSERKGQTDSANEKKVAEPQNTQQQTKIERKPARVNKNENIKKSQNVVSKEADKVLSVKEKQMLQQLFPPGLFGAGIKAYRNYSSPSEEELKLGNTIDVTQ